MEGGSAAFRVAYVQFAMVQPCKLCRNAKPKPEVGFIAAGGIPFIEMIEDNLFLIIGDADPMVDDKDFYPVVGGFCCHCDAFAA